MLIVLVLQCHSLIGIIASRLMRMNVFSHLRPSTSQALLIDSAVAEIILVQLKKMPVSRVAVDPDVC